MENGASTTAVVPTVNFGGSTRVNGERVLRRWRRPMRFRVGERPAGADSVEVAVTVVFSFGAGEQG